MLAINAFPIDFSVPQHAACESHCHKGSLRLLRVGRIGDICEALGSASAYSEGKNEIERVTGMGLPLYSSDAVLWDT